MSINALWLLPVSFLSFLSGYNCCRRVLYEITVNEVGEEAAKRIFGKKPTK